MVDLIQKEDGRIFTTSKIISDVFGKAHRKVMRDIESLGCSDSFSTANFGRSDYQTGRGKTYQCYDITEDGFYMLCMGFTGSKAMEWKEAFIHEFKSARNGVLNIDQRMVEIEDRSKKEDDWGRKWSELGHIVKAEKKHTEQLKRNIVDDVQIKLNFSEAIS